MTTHKRTKVTRMRGSKTHGHGIGAKHNKGKGNRGGCGNAGSGKRSDCKKPSSDLDPHYFGKYGFKKKNAVIVNGVNLSYFEEKLSKLAAEHLIEEKAGAYNIDLSKLGYNKLLGSGYISKKCIFTADYAAANAVEKVKKAGGDVILLKAKEAQAKEARAKEAKQAPSKEPAEKAK